MSPRGAAFLVALLLVAAAQASGSGAQGPRAHEADQGPRAHDAAPTTTTPPTSPDPAVVGELMAAFDAAYRPPSYDAMLLEEAVVAARRAAAALAPGVTLTQELAWPAYDSLRVAVSADLSVPLYDSRATIEAALAVADLASARAAAAAGMERARLDYFADVAGAATLAAALTDLADVMARSAGSPWLADASFDPTWLAPSERGAYEALLRLRGMTEFVADRSTAARVRIARATGLADADIVLPTPGAVRAYLLGIAPTPPDHAACLAAAPAAQAARLRSEQDALYERLDATPPITVVLSGTAGVGVAGLAGNGLAGNGLPGPGTGTTGGFTMWGFGFAPSASVTLEARVALPVAHVLGPDATADLRASASTTGARQSVAVTLPLLQAAGDAASSGASWGGSPIGTGVPPAAAPRDRVSAALESDLAAVAADVRTLRSGLDQAEAERARLARALAWLVLDNGLQPAGAGDLATVALRAGLDLTTLPPALAVQAVDLATQLLFADLDTLVATAQLLSACGLRL